MSNTAACNLRIVAGKKGVRSELNFNAYQRRYVALEFLYLGHDYDGLARQETTPDTIERHLFAALTRTRLIPAGTDYKDLKYTRAGRTDKGVSALGQVVALLLRSSARAGEPPVEEENELDYPSLLNNVLPEDIRVLGWTTVPDGFSARISALHREYKYLVVNRGELDVERMQQAGQLLLGQHDFRNFCKPDVVAVRNFERKMLEVRVERVASCTWGEWQLVEFYVRGTAFLWHQVRCMVAVLLMVGRGQEETSVVAELLDAVKNPRKPSYVMASDEPLLLAACGYPDLTFRRSAACYNRIRGQLEARLNSHLTRAGLVNTILEKMARDELSVAAPANRKRRLNEHVPLMRRTMGSTIEERMKAKGLVLEAEAGAG
jgi:tRNA pseudouridine38/39 synthase